MNKTTIDLRASILLIVEVVKTFGAAHEAGVGTTSSSGCQYVVTADPQSTLVPVCIVGQVFHNLGILRAMLTDGGYDQHEACQMDSGLWENAEAMGVTFTDDAKAFLRTVQRAQDNGVISPNGGRTRQWGAALNEGIRVAQEKVIAKAKEESDVFSFYIEKRVEEVTKPTVSLTKSTASEPLAEWEKELLAGN